MALLSKLSSVTVIGWCFSATFCIYQGTQIQIDEALRIRHANNGVPRGTFTGIEPVLSEDGKNMSFFEWYNQWLDDSIDSLEYANGIVWYTGGRRIYLLFLANDKRRLKKAT